MGIYIPNMEKPSCCALCLLSSVSMGKAFCSLLDKEIGEADMLTDCQLIEIDEEVFRQLKESAFIIKALYKKLKEKYKCVEEDEEDAEEDFDPYQGDRDRDTFGEIY